MAPLRSHELRLLSALLVTTWYAHRDIRIMERVLYGSLTSSSYTV